MAKPKVVITIESVTVERVDGQEPRKVSPRRSKAKRVAGQKFARPGGGRLAAECRKLDPAEEKSLAEEGLERRPTRGDRRA
jgi:hypothetical protein